MSVNRISDAGLEVAICPEYGNCAFSMTVQGQEVLWHPRAQELAQAEDGARLARLPHPDMGGIPLLAPWGNRVDRDGFDANGKRYRFNDGLDNLWREAAGYPIHGLVLFTDRWQAIRQDAGSVTSRLEFWRVPDWMAQFPFAHTIEVTHRLVAGSLEVETAVENHSSDPMPLGLMWHPYLRRPENARVTVAARQHAVMRPDHMPSGESEAWDPPRAVALADAGLDDMFTHLTGDPFLVEGSDLRWEIRFGAEYRAAQIYAPLHDPFVCVEPMTVEVNAWNRAEAAKTYVGPRGTWRETFSIRPMMPAKS
jgi:aldose 1-epimerase